MHRPARTFVLPVPLSRMLTAYTPIKKSEPNIGTGIIIPVTNPIERLNKEVKRRADVVGIFPNEASVLRLTGALLMEQDDEWKVGRRYFSVSSMALLESSQEPAQLESSDAA